MKAYRKPTINRTHTQIYPHSYTKNIFNLVHGYVRDNINQMYNSNFFFDKAFL